MGGNCNNPKGKKKALKPLTKERGSCMSGNRAQKGEAGGETKRGGVSRPQKSIGREERAEIICAFRGQRAEQIGGGGDRARHRAGVQRQPGTELIIEKEAGRKCER